MISTVFFTTFKKSTDFFTTSKKSTGSTGKRHGKFQKMSAPSGMNYMIRQGTSIHGSLERDLHQHQ